MHNRPIYLMIYIRTILKINHKYFYGLFNDLYYVGIVFKIYILIIKIIG
jgi:hypothetical protein